MTEPTTGPGMIKGSDWRLIGDALLVTESIASLMQEHTSFAKAAFLDKAIGLADKEIDLGPRQRSLLLQDDGLPREAGHRLAGGRPRLA